MLGIAVSRSRASGARLTALLATAALVVSLLVTATPTGAASRNYRNPLEVRIPGDGRVESCADPTVIRGQTAGDNYWYMYCTTDPLNDEDRNSEGQFNFRLIPMLRSTDLVNWTYMGDAFTQRPDWAESGAGLWAPEIQFFNGQYYLYFGVTDVKPHISGEPADCHFDNAIGVATSSSPLGPWTVSSTPVVEPRRAGGGCNFFWTYDPDVITAQDPANAGQKFIYYGSYYGGVEVRELSPNGLTSNPATEVQIAIPNRYEGSEVIYRDGFYYYLGSATNCCNGPLTGYSVFVGRSTSPTGPFVDREGVSLLNGRVGGSVFLTMNGNRWVGMGHQTTFQDYDGQWWTIYHAVDQNDPYFEGAVGFTKRPVLLDPVDWYLYEGEEWPQVRGGLWASDQPMKRPAAQPGDRTLYKEFRPVVHTPRQVVYREDFNGRSVGDDWTWVREESAGDYSVSNGELHMPTRETDLWTHVNTAAVLLHDLPDGNWVVETKLRLDVPAEGCCYNWVQAGLVIYGDDDNFLKLVHASIWETRQTEWAKEEFPVPEGYPRYGNTVVTAPGEWTWLRIARWARGGEVNYQAYVSRDGIHWNRGGVWTHDMEAPQIGLVAFRAKDPPGASQTDFMAHFDYVKVSKLQVQGSRPAR